MAEKKAEFVVTDRRRFGTEGEPRPDAPVLEEEKAAAPPATAKTTPPPPPVQQTTPPAAPAQPPAGQAPPVSAQEAQDEELPAPPTAEEQHEQTEAYKASGRKIDEMISAAGKAPQGGPMEMTFERV